MPRLRRRPDPMLSRLIPNTSCYGAKFTDGRSGRLPTARWPPRLPAKLDGESAHRDASRVSPPAIRRQLNTARKLASTRHERRSISAALEMSGLEGGDSREHHLRMAQVMIGVLGLEGLTRAGLTVTARSHDANLFRCTRPAHACTSTSLPTTRVLTRMSRVYRLPTQLPRSTSIRSSDPSASR